MARTHKPKLAVWKFASCDGCQLSLLDCEDELLAVAGAVEIANFPEASRAGRQGALRPLAGRRLDHHAARRRAHPRRSAGASKVLVTIGACATAGGIQALRNFKDVKDFISIVYANPAYIETLNKSTPIADHVFVDFELRGCPINKKQLVEVLSAFLNGRKPNIPTLQRLRGVQAARDGLRAWWRTGTPCLGPVTQAGCGALCPAYRPRLLRLLRPEGDAQHRSRSRAVWQKLGHDERRRSCGRSAASTPTRSRSARRVKPHEK